MILRRTILMRDTLYYILFIILFNSLIKVRHSVTEIPTTPATTGFNRVTKCVTNRQSVTRFLSQVVTIVTNHFLFIIISVTIVTTLDKECIKCPVCHKLTILH